MPLWATVTTLGVVVSVGGFLVKYLVASSRTLGKIEGLLEGNAERLGRAERHISEHEAELVAMRNGYNQRPQLYRWH